MKVLFDHPNPFFLAHGGFQIQVEQTKLALERAGASVDWLRWWDSDQKADLIHYFGRPHPAYIQQCHEKGLKVVMAELLTGLGSRPTVARKIQKNLMAVARKTLPYDFISRLGWESYRLADVVIANTAWEHRLMVEMFDSPPNKTRILPNGVEEVFFLLPGESPQREQHLLCTGTITPRKRVLELCLAAELAQVPLHVIGAPYFQEDLYYQRFIAVISKTKSVVKYLGACEDRSALAKAYKKAAGFALLSSMETRSLSAEEAAAAGCPLFLTDLPWARSVFGEFATYCPWKGIDFLAARLKDFFNGISKVPRPVTPLRWKEVGHQLTGIYREAVNSR